MAKKNMRVTQNSFEWLVTEFLASSKFASLALNSQALWGRELRMAAKVMGRAFLKAKSEKHESHTIRPKMVLDYLGALGDTPRKAEAALAALRALNKWGQVCDLLPRDITSGVTVPGGDGGHIPWSDEQVALAVKHARPDLARAVLLASCTGQRASDLVKMCWLDVHLVEGRPGIRVVQKKTGKRLWIPIDDTLAGALATWERKDHGRILYDMKGNPWTEERLSESWRYERRKNPALAPLLNLVIHGLRGHVCVRLFRSGCNTKQIADMVGMSEGNVKEYTKLSSIEQNNLATILRLENFRGTAAKKAENEG